MLCVQSVDFVPNILLVLGGTQETLKHVQQAIQNHIAILVVRGSGGMADILAYAYLNALEKKNENEDTTCNTQKMWVDRITILLTEHTVATRW